MKLLTKALEKKLQAQYALGADMANQKVIAKFFNPYGRGTWYVMNQDPEDPDYLWGIVDLIEVEAGSFSLKELEGLKVPPFGLGLERDMYYEPKNALEVYRKLIGGNVYADGGMVSVLNKGEEFNEAKYEAIFGDYDKDGIVNIDDAHPLKKGKGKVEQIPLAKTFKKVLDTKKDLDSAMYTALDKIKGVTSNSARVYARTKTPYSIVNKLVEKRMLDIKNPKKGLTDMVGTMIVVPSEAELHDVKDKIAGGKLGEVFEVEDFYKNPKAGYRAVHFIIIGSDGIPFEVQLKTKRQKEITEYSHTPYKLNNLNVKTMDKLSKVAQAADAGKKEAVKEWETLTADSNKLRKQFYEDETLIPEK